VNKYFQIDSIHALLVRFISSVVHPEFNVERPEASRSVSDSPTVTVGPAYEVSKGVGEG
jgi:hypothetical protein